MFFLIDINVQELGLVFCF